jgi:hypothetical protein
MDNAMEQTPSTRGRPRRWSTEAEKHRYHRARQRNRLGLLDELLHVLRNARWDDPELHTIMNMGDDTEVLSALIAHYGARHWMRSDIPSGRSAGGEEDTIERTL